MKLIGLSGPAGVGKDTIADYLVLNYGFTKFSFADPLYLQVAEAFGVTVEFLQNRANKEKPQEALQYWYCKDRQFQDIMWRMLSQGGTRFPMDTWLSPRQVLQWWGTEYRRAEDPEYWIKQADLFVRAWLERQRELNDSSVGGLVQTSVRFANERAFIEMWNGEVWHVQRPDWNKTVAASQAAHVAEAGLPILERDKVVVNNGTIEQLHTVTSLLLQADAGTHVKCATDEHPEFVSCGGCGRVYRTMSCGEVRAEIEQLHAWIDTLPESEQAKRATAKMLCVADYSLCETCGSDSFVPVPKGEGPARYRQDVPGVLY